MSRKALQKKNNLADWIRAQIDSGALPPGDRIYSEPQFAKMFSISRYTVRNALLMLEREGLLVRLRGSGTYVSERAVRRPAQMRSRVIGVVSTSADDYIFPVILRGINDCLSASGYTMNLAISYNQIGREEQILRAMLDIGCDGLIFEPIKSALPKINRDLYQELMQRVPCVLINCRYPEMPLPCVAPDNKRGAEIAMDYLIDRGHTRIIGIFKLDDTNGLDRYAGYAASLPRRGLPYVDRNVLWLSTEDFDHFFDANGPRLLALLRECTAVLCYNDQIALSLTRFLGENGKKVPDDVSVISFDDSLIAQLEVPLTTIAHPKAELGRRAAQNLLHLMDTPTFDAAYSFPPVLVERSSVRAL